MVSELDMIPNAAYMMIGVVVSKIIVIGIGGARKQTSQHMRVSCTTQ
jgi:hypothetical protein